MIMIDSNTVFTKSDKGWDIINKSSRELTRAERHILILVDGNRTAAELISQLSVIQNVASLLEGLFKKGLITILKSQSAATGAPSKAVVKPAQPQKKASYSLTEHNVSVLENAVIEFLGPMGGLIMSDILSKSDNSFEKTIALISAELTADQQQQFKQMVSGKIFPDD